LIRGRQIKAIEDDLDAGALRSPEFTVTGATATQTIAITAEQPSRMVNAIRSNLAYLGIAGR
jgi:hypothetical protein